MECEKCGEYTAALANMSRAEGSRIFISAALCGPCLNALSDFMRAVPEQALAMDISRRIHGIEIWATGQRDPYAETTPLYDELERLVLDVLKPIAQAWIDQKRGRAKKSA